MKKVALALSAMFQKLVDTASTPVRLWPGKVALKNPETQQPTGKFRNTLNLDFDVAKSLYDKVKTWCDTPSKEKDGNWVRIDVLGKEMVLIDYRIVKKGEDERYIAQFSVPNHGSWEEIGNSAFKDTFTRLFATANTVDDVAPATAKTEKTEKAESKASVKDGVDEEFEKLMNQS